MKRILIADDEPIILKVLKEDLTRANFCVSTVDNGLEALAQLRKNKYDLAILDVRMPKMDGISLLTQLAKTKLETVIIMMTAFGTIRDAVTSMKYGAYDYITKPFDSDDLLRMIHHALKVREKLSVDASFSLEQDKGGIVGQSADIARIKVKLQKIKNLDSTVLFLGESGTGKSVLARELHNIGNRKDMPFVHVNCAVLPPSLIESELFGHEKGAFTGATEIKKGKIELAGNGTLFLDEIGSLPLNLQAKLLTVLQERSMERVGGVAIIPVTARIIAATNINIEEAVKRREFREDLYYRLNVITIECPPLRFRKEDIRALALHFLEKFNRKFNKQIATISEGAWQIINNYDWPGNTRELENTLESAVALSTENTLAEEDLPLRICGKTANAKPNSKGVLESQEIMAIIEVLDKHNGHREKAAKELGISRRTLQHKLNKFELRDKPGIIN